MFMQIYFENIILVSKMNGNLENPNMSKGMSIPIMILKLP